VPVEADSAAAAESKVAALDAVERLRDKPTTKMDVA
jgi:hypothetical protein